MCREEREKGGRGGGLHLWRSLRCLELGSCRLERILARSFGGLGSLTQLLLSGLCLASRLAELLLCLPEFALEALQLALESANLTLDSLDPVDRGILRISHDRQDRRTDCSQRAAGAMAAAAFITHAPPSPFRETRREPNNNWRRHLRDRQISAENRLHSRAKPLSRKGQETESAPLDRSATRRHLPQTRRVPLRGHSQHRFGASAFLTRYRYFEPKGADSLRCGPLRRVISTALSNRR